MPRISENKSKLKEEKSSVIKKTAKDMTVDRYMTDGSVNGKASLPKAIFQVKVNTSLLVQALRIYQERKRHYSASSKTRGEVQGSTRKIYRQKGTGRARHGAIRAPIFVGGGVAHGPKVKVNHLKLPKKMKRAAVLSACSNQMENNAVKVVDGMLGPDWKTAQYANLFQNLDCHKKTLVLLPKNNIHAKLMIRNIPQIKTISTKDINAYEIMKYKHIIIPVESIDELSQTFS